MMLGPSHIAEPDCRIKGHLTEFEWFLLFLYASFLEVSRDMLISGQVL